MERVCRYLDISRSSHHRRLARDSTPPPPAQKRGPKTYEDEELTDCIRQAIATSPFLTEGYRKVSARLRLGQIRTSKRRVNRLMREAALLSPSRVSQARPEQAHEGTIITVAPEQMWSTDASSCLMRCVARILAGRHREPHDRHAKKG